MSKKEVIKTPVIVAEVAVLFIFIVGLATSSLSLLNLIVLTDEAKALLGYTLGGFFVLAVLYVIYKAVKAN